MSDEPAQHISEQVSIYKKHLNHFSKYLSKFSSELPDFIYKNKMVQSDLLNDLYERSSLLQGLLREIMEQELNAETFEQLVRLQSEEEDEQGHSHCTCPHCKHDKEDGYYDDEEEDE